MSSDNDPLKQLRLQLIRQIGGEPVPKPSTVTPPRRRRWALPPRLPLGGESSHPALPNRMFRTLRSS